MLDHLRSFAGRPSPSSFVAIVVRRLRLFFACRLLCIVVRLLRSPARFPCRSVAIPSSLGVVDWGSSRWLLGVARAFPFRRAGGSVSPVVYSYAERSGSKNLPLEASYARVIEGVDGKNMKA
jgi:hypothetical protein